MAGSRAAVAAYVGSVGVSVVANKFACLGRTRTLVRRPFAFETSCSRGSKVFERAAHALASSVGLAVAIRVADGVAKQGEAVEVAALPCYEATGDGTSAAATAP